jgi:hypothetical protein
MSQPIHTKSIEFTHVKDSERHHDTNIPPPMLILNIETRQQELIRGPD